MQNIFWLIVRGHDPRVVGAMILVLIGHRQTTLGGLSLPFLCPRKEFFVGDLQMRQSPRESPFIDAH